MQETKVGRPLMLEKKGLKEKILHALAKGATYKLACGYAGITVATFYEWMKKGKPLVEMREEDVADHPDKVYYELYCDVRRYESYAAIKWLEKIDAAATVHWQAAAWKLERRYPQEYGKRERENFEEDEDTTLDKAKADVKKLMSDDHGRSSTTTD
jgi:transposase